MPQKEENGKYIILDVGGTAIKAALLDCDGNIKGSGIERFPAFAKEDMTTIFDNFAMILSHFMDKKPAQKLLGIGFAFPGPFDYDKGISLMQGLDKYDSIYGVEIGQELLKRLPILQNVPLCFLHDVEAFAVGISHYGDAKDADRILCLCIGTGAGSAFVENKKIQKEENDALPKNGWLYSCPYKDSIIDDYISVRGLLKLSEQIIGQPLDGKTLFELSNNGNEKAIAVYRLFGEDLVNAIAPFIDKFKPNCLVLGGEISKSFCYFGNQLLEECAKKSIAIHMEEDTSFRAMQGLYVTMKERIYDDIK